MTLHVAPTERPAGRADATAAISARAGMDWQPIDATFGSHSLARYIKGGRSSEVVLAYYKRHVDSLPPWLTSDSENDSYQNDASSVPTTRGPQWKSG